jgi:hypothetical protein
MTLVANFQFTGGIVDSGEKFSTGINTSAVLAGGKFTASAVDTGGKFVIISANFRKNLK